MERWLAFLLFISVFMAVVIGSHLYVFYRLSGLLGLRRGVFFWIALLVASFSFIAANMLNSRYHNTATKVVYSISASWIGIMLFTLMVLAIYEVLKYVLDIEPRVAAIGIMSVVALITAVALLNGMGLHVKHIALDIEGLEKETRVVQLSDIHVGTLRNSQFLARVVDRVNALDPDMVLITGDLVDGSAPLWDLRLDELRRLKARAFFSVGNHERYEGLEDVIPIIEAGGLTVLRNRMEPYKGIQLIGIDDPDREWVGSYPLLSGIEFDRNHPSILMLHRPIGYNESAERGISLQLSGHTHSGQIFPFILGTRLAFKYPKGLHRFKDTYMYVSPGTGTWGPPMRLGSRNEITVFTLRPSGGAR